MLPSEGLLNRKEYHLHVVGLLAGQVELEHGEPWILTIEGGNTRVDNKVVVLLRGAIGVDHVFLLERGEG